MQGVESKDMCVKRREYKKKVVRKISAQVKST